MDGTRIIYQGNARISQKKHKKDANYKEFPYYLSNNLDGLRIMIREIAQSDKVLDAGFVLEITKKSKYLKSMRKKFGKEVTKMIADELRKSYPPYANPRFKVFQQLFDKDGITAPFLEDDLEDSMAMNLERPSELEFWYYIYLSERQDQESSSQQPR